MWGLFVFFYVRLNQNFCVVCFRRKKKKKEEHYLRETRMNNDENYQQPQCKVQEWELSAIVSVPPLLPYS